MQIHLFAIDENEMTGVTNYINNLYKEFVKEKFPINIKKYLFKKINLNFLFVNLKDFLKNYPLFFPKGNEGIIHLPNYSYALPLLLRKRNKTVITIHDLIPSVYKFPSVINQMLYKLCLIGIKKADWIITDSENTRKEIIRLLGYPAMKIMVVPLGVNKTVFRKKRSIEKERYSILYVGTEMPRKNLDILIKAFAKLKQKLPNARLIKVGKSHWPGAREKLMNLARNLKVLDSIEFKDYVEDIVTEYNKAELFVFPSLYEGFGLPVLEAMACEVPVICSDKTSLPEVGGDAVVYFDGHNINDLTEKMFKILTDKRRQKILIKKGLVQAQKFSWKETAKKTIEVYKKVG